ncbi:TonB-dependent receptor domain-containing protein [Acidihalobacter prosperus]
MSAKWKATHNMMLFANYGVAYREPSNGGGGGPFQSVPAYALQLEKGTTYQMGAKWHYGHAPLLNNFLASVNYFYTRYSNQYISSSSNGHYLGTGKGSSHYEGVDFDINDEPIRHVYAFLNGTVEKAKFDNYTTGGVSYQGLWVSQVPSYTYNLGGEYKWFHQGIMYEPRLWYSEIGSQHIWNNNIGAPGTQKMPAYGTLNLGLDLDIPTHGHVVKVSLSVLNALNKKYNVYEYVSAGGYFGGNSAGATLAYPGAPLTADLSIQADF